MTSLAHVSYTVDPAKLEALAGSDWGFVLSPLSDPLYLTLIVITLVVSVVGFVVGETFAPIRDYCRAIHDRLLEYRNHVPFFLRLALAVALIISGTRQFIFLPNVPGAGIGNLEIFLGFSILVGFMVRVSALAVLGVYIYGLVTSHYLLGTMESAAAALVVAAYGAKTGPSIDGILGVDVLGKMCERMWNHICENTGPIIRVALGFTLMWLAVTEKAMNPRVCEAVVIDLDL